jgi:crotonobetaine/carnitine-CoA ligase
MSATHRTRVDHDVPVPMRDGTVLRADVWRRDDDQLRPAVLFRTPYDKSASPLGTLSPAQCVAGGYAAVVQDTRGRFSSEGPWAPLQWDHEGADGHDTIEWVASEPWSDGNVVMAGTSYQAIVQWLAAMERPEHLRAIAPAMSTSAELDVEQTGGAMRLDHLTSWLALTALEWIRRKGAAGTPAGSEVVDEVMSLLLDPASEVLWRPPARMLDFDGFPGRIRDVVEGHVRTMVAYDYDTLDVPTLSISGWYDVFAYGTVELHRRMRGINDTAGRHRLVMGPWAHAGQLPQVQGELNTGMLGSALGANLARTHLSFFDRHIGRTPLDQELPPAVSYFLMGANIWRAARAWPPESSAEQTWTLGGAPAAPNTGLLTAPDDLSASDGHQDYVYDPDDPTPSRGGRVLQLGTLVAGPLDQSHIEARKDVVSYTSELLKTMVVAVGRHHVDLEFCSDAVSTDLVVKLCDVEPDGRSIVVAEGYLRVAGLIAGEPSLHTVLLGDAAWRFEAGHRLRVSVASSHFPHLDRNPNTGESPATATRRQRAHQRVLHGGSHRSVLRLQVEPAPVPKPHRVAGPAQRDLCQEAPLPDHVLDPADASMPTREQCVLEPLLRTRAEQCPEAVYAVFENETVWTYASSWSHARQAAAALQANGVSPGDRVMSWLPNGPDALRTWFGTNLAGAVAMPINLAYRGAMLQHVVSDGAAGILVTRPALAAHLLSIDCSGLNLVVLLPGPDDEPSEVLVDQLVAAGMMVTVGLEADAADFVSPAVAVEPWDTQTIIFTSGTTGPSKGVLSSYAHLYSSCTAAFHGRTSSNDRYLLQLPLFHAGGTIGAYGMLVHGASVAVVNSFRTDDFWNVVRRTGVTMCTLLGVMATYLLKAPARSGDADHCLRQVFIIPLGQEVTFGERFGVRVHVLFNMTEVSCPLIGIDAPAVSMYCGRVRDGVEARLVDGQDRQVAPGQVGELLLRTLRPWAMAHGYHRRPEAFVAAWRNGWFHTGDSFRQLPDGSFVFVDRLRDMIRRRGENISSYEVEAQALRHTGVREAAAVAVSGDDGESEVLLVISATDTMVDPIDPVELCVFLQAQLAHFMVPRYVRIVEAIPLTATNKPRKDILRLEGVTAATWDRHASAMTVRMERVR